MLFCAAPEMWYDTLPFTLHHSVHHELKTYINPLNTELNPICYLLALVGAHHIVHVSRVRLKLKFSAWNMTQCWLFADTFTIFKWNVSLSLNVQHRILTICIPEHDVSCRWTRPTSTLENGMTSSCNLPTTKPSHMLCRTTSKVWNQGLCSRL